MGLRFKDSFPKRFTMSHHNHYAVKADADHLRQAFGDSSLRAATIIADANDLLFKAQSEAASAALADSSKHLAELLNARDPSAWLAAQTALYQANISRALDVWRAYFEIMPRAQ